MCMLEAVIEGILTNHNDIKSLTKHMNKFNNVLYTSLIAGSILLYKMDKKIKMQDTQISEFKKELEMIKTEGE